MKNDLVLLPRFLTIKENTCLLRRRHRLHVDLVLGLEQLDVADVAVGPVGNHRGIQAQHDRHRRNSQVHEQFSRRGRDGRFIGSQRFDGFLAGVVQSPESLQVEQVKQFAGRFGAPARTMSLPSFLASRWQRNRKETNTDPK